MSRSKSLEYYYQHREKVLAYQKKRWKIKYATDENFRAKRQLRDLSRNDAHGRKINLSGEYCRQCGNNKNLQRHHPNYNNISYIILCRKCHNQLHNQNLFFP